jgi:hypothetical protein
MAAHGHPRFKKDLDVWVWMDPANGALIDNKLAAGPDQDLVDVAL